jgi:hypothetical protein
MENPMQPCTWMTGVTGMFQLDLLRDGNGDVLDGGRTLALSGADSMPKAGRYRVVPVSVKSDNVTGTRGVIWPVDDDCDGAPYNDTTKCYVFEVLLDCNDNGVADSVDIANSGCPGGGGCIDMNLNGIIDTCEMMAVDCRCEMDGNNFVNADDLFIFLDYWFAQIYQTGPGHEADIDANEIVDADDLFEFLDCWFLSNGHTCD